MRLWGRKSRKIKPQAWSDFSVFPHECNRHWMRHLEFYARGCRQPIKWMTVTYFDVITGSGSNVLDARAQRKTTWLTNALVTTRDSSCSLQIFARNSISISYFKLVGYCGRSWTTWTLYFPFEINIKFSKTATRLLADVRCTEKNETWIC